MTLTYTIKNLVLEMKLFSFVLLLALLLPFISAKPIDGELHQAKPEDQRPVNAQLAERRKKFLRKNVRQAKGIKPCWQYFC